MFGDAEPGDIGTFLTVLERLVDQPPEGVAKSHISSLEHILKRANGFTGDGYDAFCTHLAGPKKPPKKPKLNKTEVEALANTLVIVEPVNEAFEATVKQLFDGHLTKTLLQLARIYSPGSKPKTKAAALKVIQDERAERMVLTKLERLKFAPDFLTLDVEPNELPAHKASMDNLNRHSFAAAAYDERRRGDRVPVGSSVRIVSTDLMSARPARLIDLSKGGARIEWTDTEESAPKHFYAMLSGKELGRIRTLCERRWQVGQAVGVRFVSALSEDEFSDVINFTSEEQPADLS